MTVPELINREIIYFWYYFSVMLSQIAVYWIVGMILGSLISVFGKGKIHSMFAAMQKSEFGILGIIGASLLGIASPLCMYGTIPVVASFAKNRTGEDAPYMDGELAAFMMSSILLNPQLIFYSAALGTETLVIRIVSCFLCGITAGLLIDFFYTRKRKRFFTFSVFEENTDRDTDPNLFFRFAKNLWRNIKVTGPAFLIGISIAALFQRYVSAEIVSEIFGKHRAFGLLMAATVGVPLYVCGGGTIPILISWMSRGMPLGAAAAFMIAGPAMKITNLGALKIILGMRGFLLYIIYSAGFALLTGFLIDL